MDNPAISFRFLPDRPASEDAFGSHEKVADAILDTILSQPGGKTIGIQGGWGSGKSTIVSLLTAKLRGQSDHLTIVFDAWTHEGDPLRRSFLQQLISQLISATWLPEDKWKTRNLELARRGRTTTTKTTRGITAAGKSLALATLLVPLAAIILRVSQPTPSSSAIDLAIGLALLPAVLIVLLSIVNILLRAVGRPTLQFLQSESVESAQAITSEDPEPSSVEFRSHYDDILEDALQNNSRTLTLIIDNLDRVASQDAKTIWSTLRVFLEPSAPRIGPDISERLWVIVPFDEASLEYILPSEAQDGQRLSRSFRNKIFQVIFYAPVPTLTDWENYLLGCLSRAFGEKAKALTSDFHRLYRLYAMCVADDNHRTTPRELLLFVNELGALYLQWGNAIPIPVLGYYVLLRRQMSESEVAKRLISGALPERSRVPLLGSNAAEYLAGLLYNTDSASANQILLRGEVEGALNRNDASALEKALNGHPAAAHVLENLLPALLMSWLPDEPHKVLQTINILADAPQTTRNRLRTSLQEAVATARELDHWTQVDSSTIDAVRHMLEVTPGAATATDIAKTLAASSGLRNRSDQDVIPLPTSANLLIDLYKLLALNGAKLPTVELPVSPTDWLETSKQIYKLDPDGHYWRFIQPSFGDSTTLSSHLAATFQQPQPADGALEALEIGIASSLVANREQLLVTIAAKLRNPTGIQPTAIRTYVLAMIRLSDDTGHHQQMHEWTQSGMALHYFHEAFGSRQYSAAGACMYAYLCDFPGRTGHQAQHHAGQGLKELNDVIAHPQDNKQTIDAFIDLLKSSNKLSLLGRLVQADQSALPLFCCATDVLESVSGLLTSDEFASCWSLIKEAANAGNLNDGVYQALLMEQIFSGALFSRLTNEPMDPGRAGLYADAIEIASENDRTQFIEWLAVQIDQLPEEDMAAAIEQNKPLLQLLVSIRQYVPQFSLHGSFCDAVLQNAKGTMGGAANAAWDDQLQHKVLDLLPDDDRRTLGDQMRNALIFHGGNVHEAFFRYYGTEILDVDALARSAALISDLFIALVKANNEAGINWMTRLLSTTPFLERCQFKHQIETLKARVQESLNDANEHDTPLRDLAATLGITPSPGNVDQKR